jgi:outer membrane protein assembly factor BamD
MTFARTAFLLCLLSAPALLGACAARPAPAVSDYAGQAQYAYEEAMSAYDSSEYLEALKRFNYVRTKFPYSQFSALASLRIADTYFAQSQMPSAIEAYRRFLQLHPSHPDVPYAEYRIGLAYYEQLPGDWFFMPPAYEKDLASTEEAEAALNAFLNHHPNSQYAEEISEKLSVVRQRLADHEFFVATFYLRREEPRAAAQRLQFLLERYPGLGFDEEALFLQGKCFLLLKNVPAAASTWGTLIQQYPDHPLAREASLYLQRHRLDAPAPDASSRR